MDPLLTFDYSCGVDNLGHVVVAFWRAGKRPSMNLPLTPEERFATADFAICLSPLAALTISASLQRQAMRQLEAGFPAVEGIVQDQPMVGADDNFDRKLWGSALPDDFDADGY